MRLKRALLLVGIGVFGLTSCNVENSDDNLNINNSSNEKISLNIHQTDLIADITDNEKYLNKNYLYDLVSLDDSDKINIIVTLDSGGLADEYNKNKGNYNSLSEYAEGSYATSLARQMNLEQDILSRELFKENFINNVNHKFTTLFNGFSAETTYGQYKKLVKANLGVNVTVSEVYTEPEYKMTSSSSYEEVVNFVNVYGTGIFNSSGVGYDGENTAVAILDSGFDIHHTVFQNMPKTPMITRNDVDAVLKDSKAYGYHKNIKVQDVFMNDKIPFVYDYADKDADVAPYDSDHGTHVAGIIGGKDDVITGVAINTQLVLMKVFGDINNGAIQDDILAALEDSILLGVDAINLSLGSACGFARSADNEYINVVYDKIEEAGISLIVAASNDYSSGYGGENSNTNKATNPDSATVGSPGTYDSTLSVASISGVKSKYMVDEEGHTFFFNNANNNAGEAYDFYEMLYNKLGETGEQIEVEYVTVPGVGKKVNYSNIDVEGKIALVKRGDTSFEEKAAVALSKGAIGCIIYNNVAGDVFMNAGSGLQIALCSVNKDDGEVLASKSRGTLILNKNFLAGPFMSEFSSWGPVSNLQLKPEITAHGGSILSSVPGGGYEEISGTSMACPNLCGVVILVRQFLKEKYENITAVELTTLTNQLLMSTGTIVLDEQGNPYSPRKQGAGLANLEATLETLAYISVEGTKKAKLDLMDDPEETGVYELVFDINNTSNKELKYSISNQTMTESLSTADPNYVAEKAYMLNPSSTLKVTGAGKNDGDVITINPNGSVTVTYTLKLSTAEKKYIRKSFPNGIYVEGFAILNSMNEDKINLSVPFLAFFGDWTVAPMFDKTFYEVESEKYNGGIDEEDKLKADYYATTPLGTYYHSYIIPLGSFVYEIDKQAYDMIPASEEHAAIGYNIETINGITTVYAGLLRNAKKMTTQIVNTETGEVVYDHVKYDEHKAYFSGSIVPGYDLINLTARDMGLQNNTKYTFTMKAELDYDDGGVEDNLNNTFEFSFYVDYEAPIITNAEFYSKYDKSLKDYRYYVDVFVYDNHYAQSIRPFTIVDGKLVSLSEYVIPIYNDVRGGISKVTLEITDYMDLLQYGLLEDNNYALTNGLGFLVDDYALNQSYSYVTLPGTDSVNIKYKDEYISGSSGSVYTYKQRLNIGDELDLSYMLTSDDMMDEDPEVQAKYFSSLKWESTNENIIKVYNGKIEAVGAGTAMVKCTTMRTDGYIYTTTLKLTVRSSAEKEEKQKVTDIQFTYFDVLKAFIDGPDMSEIGKTGDRFFFTEKSSISFYPSEKVKLGYQLEPWNLKDYELIWDSTNDKVATVDENGVVTALKEGSATITLKVKVGNSVSTLVASARVNVKSEFVIEGQTLVAYKGMGGDVVIPDDEGILYVGPYAFSLYTTDYSIKIEEDDYDAAKTPDANNSVKSVTIPGDVKEVQKFAFYKCTALESVKFLKNSEGDSCPLIREYAFAFDENLTTINLDDVGIIGTSAFEGCKKLDNIDISYTFAIGARAFKDCKNLKYVDITALRNAGFETFAGCTSLTTIDNGEFTNFATRMFVNSGLKTLDFEADRIPDLCFANCKDLETVNIVNDVVYVGSKAFLNCEKLTNVVFSDIATSEFIYESAFANCTALKSIVLPNSDVIVEGNIFENCSSLTSITFNAATNITNNLGNILKGCTALEKFTVNSNNPYYESSNNLLLNKAKDTIILAAPKYEYNEYTIPAGIKNVAEGAFSSITTLTKLNVLDEIVIGKSAFENCSNLVEVVLGNDVEIKDKAFSDCTKLATVNLNVLDYYAPYAFNNTALTNIVLADNSVIAEGAFANIKALLTVDAKNATIGDNAFINAESLTNVIINTDTIGAYAFANAKELSTIDLSKVTIIGDYAFSGCTLLSDVDLTDVITIGNYAFFDCTNIDTLSLENVQTIGDYAFASTSETTANHITELTLPATLSSVGSYAFSNIPTLTSVNIGNADVEFGSFAFAYNSNLVSFASLGTIKTISEAMFYENLVLEEVKVNGIEYVLEGAFINCVKLKSIDLSNVIEIGLDGFKNCTSLETVSLDNCVKLDKSAFMTCTNLYSIYMPKIEIIDSAAIAETAVTEIKLPSTIKEVAAMAFLYNTKLVKFTNMDGLDTCDINEYVKLDNGVLYTVTNNGKYLLSSYPTAKPETEYEVIFNTVRIEEYAGYANEYIKKIIFPDTLKLIGNMCFIECKKLDTVEFKSTVAPVLEGTVSDIGSEYDKNSEIYKLLNKYFQFNGYYPLFYGQFRNMIGMNGKLPKLNIILPNNKDVEGYDNILYKLYFNLDEVKTSEHISMNKYSIDYLNKIVLVPTEVKLSDEMIIQDARTAYNLLNQDLTEYGYDQEYLDELLENLEKAEKAWKDLKMERINKVYEFLIEDIEALGSTYSFEKISDYYAIVDVLDRMDKNDKRYIDTTNVDKFKTEFDEYFKDLSEDINTLDDINTLPTTTVNKVGVAIAVSIIGGSSLFALAGLFFKKYWLF